MSELPFIDEHTREIGAPPPGVWEALRQVVPGSFSGRRASRVATLLGTDPGAVAGELGAEGSSFPGFRVTRSSPSSELALAGSHRFSTYELVFRIDDLGSGRSRLRAETRAAFPGLKGRLYRAAVIGTRGHVLATTRILRAVERRAERARIAA